METPKQYGTERVKGISTVFRIEHPITGLGLWYNLDGTPSDLPDRIKKSMVKDIPMPYSDIFRTDGKIWFSGVPDIMMGTVWLDLEGLLELEALGHEVYAYLVTEAIRTGEHEIAFTKESTLAKIKVDPGIVYGEEYYKRKSIPS